MDYEKMYNEALERAKKLTSDMTTLQKIREFIFPELRESEDERTKKELLDYIKYNKEHTPETTPGEHWDRWIAYLEKQKEQKPAEWSEEEKNGMFSDIILAIRAFYMCGREDLVDYVKSLRPSWKPSEGQIEALERAVSWYSDTKQCDAVLCLLLSDLKKLM